MPGALTLLLLATALAVAVLLRDRLGAMQAAGVGLSATFLTASAVGLVLLDLGRLHPWSLRASLLAAFAILLIAAALLRRALPRADAPVARDGRWPAGALAAVALALGVMIRLDPSPYLHGGQDQGIYVNVGHHIARTGRLRPIDRLMAGRVRGVAGSDVRATHRISPIAPDSPLKGVREGRWFAGIHVEDADRGVLIPAFFHLMPVWFAMAEHDWGFARSTWPLVLFWLLSALAAFGLAVRLHRMFTGPTEDPGRRAVLVGALAVAALALHPLDLWISTFTVTENLARACLLGAAWLALEGASAEREGRAGATLLSTLGGLCFAAGAFARGSLVAYALVLTVALLVSPIRARSRAALLVSLVVGTTLAVVQAVMHSWPYFFSAASNHFHVPRLRPHQDVAVVSTLAVGVFVLAVDRGLEALRGRPRFAARARWSLRAAAWALLAAAVVVLLHEAIAPSNEWGRDQQVLPVLLRYSGPVPLLLGVAALALAARRADDRTLPWTLLGAAIVLLTALKQGIRYEFYYARYLVGDAVPALLVGAACLLGHITSRARDRWGRRAAALVLAAVTLAWLAPPLRALTREVYWTRDLADAPEQLAAMFGHVPNDAVLLFDAREPGRWRGILATPALLSFGRHVLLYPNNELVERALKAGTPVYMISGGWDVDRQRWPDAERGPWRTEVVARGTYRALRAEVTEGRMPAQLTDWGGPYEVQRFDPSIWRSSGAFSLYPGSGFVREREGALATETMTTPWPPGSRAELWLAAEARDCELAAVLTLDGESVELAAAADDRADRRLWSMPDPRPGAPWVLTIRGTCGARRPTWRWLSVRPGQP